jgi:hypothetical protein
MRYFIIPYLILLYLASCRLPYYDMESKQLQRQWRIQKQWKKCQGSIYAAGVDTARSFEVHFVLCKENRFNALVWPIKRVSRERFYCSGTYVRLVDTVNLTFDRNHSPMFLNNILTFSRDKKKLFWSKSDYPTPMVLNILADRNWEEFNGE